MARRSQHSFLKRQKEIERKDEATGKMARRQGKVERAKGSEETESHRRRRVSNSPKTRTTESALEEPRAAAGGNSPSLSIFVDQRRSNEHLRR